MSLDSPSQLAPPLPEPVAENGAAPAAAPAPNGLQQLLKFCVVGASSTAVTQGSLYGLMTYAEHNAPSVPWWVWSSIAFCFGVSNGFFWNRRWTFSHARQLGNAGGQYFKFVLTNFIGLCLNLMFTKLFLVLFTGQMLHDQNPDKKVTVIASLCAVPCVVIWNFTAAKFWTFKN